MWRSDPHPDEPGDVHVLPVEDLVDHDTSRGCWCGPRIERPCTECEPTVAISRAVTIDTTADTPGGSGPAVVVEYLAADPGCWRCAGTGVVEPASELPAVVVHNAADGRP